MLKSLRRYPDLRRAWVVRLCVRDLTVMMRTFSMVATRSVGFLSLFSFFAYIYQLMFEELLSDFGMSRIIIEMSSLLFY